MLNAFKLTPKSFRLELLSVYSYQNMKLSNFPHFLCSDNKTKRDRALHINF